MNNFEHCHVTADEIKRYRAIGINEFDFNVLDFVSEINDKLQNCHECDARYKLFDRLTVITGDPPPAMLQEGKESLTEKLKKIIEAKTASIINRAEEVSQKIITDVANLFLPPPPLPALAGLRGATSNVALPTFANKNTIRNFERGNGYVTFELMEKTKLFCKVSEEFANIANYELTIYFESGDEQQYPLKITDSGILFVTTNELDKGCYGAIISEVS
jgi:hypothetical protein